jgi:large subunit ribosomal protein L10
MAKTKEQKIKAVENLEDKIKKSKSIILVNYEGLKVSDIQLLRKLLKKEAIDYLVAKKTLFKRACKETKLDVDPKAIPGNFALVFAYADEVAPAKILAKFAKDNEKLKIVAGIFDGKLIAEKQVIILSKLPGKQELLAKLVGSINSPVSGFVTVLAGNLRGLVQVLSQIKK